MKKNHCMLIYYQAVVTKISGKILKKYYISKRLLKNLLFGETQEKNRPERIPFRADNEKRKVYLSKFCFNFSKKREILGWDSLLAPSSSFRSSSFCSRVSFVGVSTTTVTSWSPRVLLLT